MQVDKDLPPLVLHVVHRFSTGGLENGVVNLINRMPPQRWRHAVVALTDVDPAFAQRVLRPDVQFFALHKPPGQAFWLYPRLWRLFRQLKPAVVHTRNLGTLEFQLPAWLAGVPARVHGEHGRDRDDLDGNNRVHQWLRRFYRPFVGHYIALGSELAAYLREKVGVSSSALTPICNGVDHERFHPSVARHPIPGCPFQAPELWLFGTVGRMQTVKAQTLLVQAFIALLQQHPALQAQVRLVIVGDGPLRAECEALLADAGFAHLAWLPGERSDVADVMRGLNCFVLPSLVEGISNTILEAMACGLPVLATQVGGTVDLVTPGVTGRLVQAGDVPALCNAMAAMAMNRSEAQAMGRAGRQSVEAQFSLPAMVSAYEGVYDRMLHSGVKE